MSLHGPAPPSGPSPARPSGLVAALAFLLGAAAILALEWVWQGRTYWLFSEGVYLATARAVLDGESLYREVAAAQPPTIFYLGAGLVAISDSVLWVRAALSLASVATAALVALAVLRLTGRRGVAALAGLASLLMPWTLREHATLTPEPLAAPLLLGTALLAARTRLSAVAGVLGVVAATFKLAFLLPVAAVGMLAAAPARYFSAAIAAGLALAAGALAVWGGPLIDNLIVAQGETGFQPGVLPGLFAQAAWNLAPLAALALLAALFRGRARDPALLRTLAALFAASLALLLTFVKDGSYLNLVAVIEPAGVPLAAAGLVWLVEDRGRLARGARLVPALAAGAAALCAAQTAGLLIAPGNPHVFGNPFLDPPPGYVLSSEQVEATAQRARACPPGVPYSGSPFLAFVADRPLPGGQADQFIVREAPTHADLRRQVIAAQPRCP